MSTLTTKAADADLAPHERYVPGSHWRNLQDETEGAKLGMWLFLGTEILLFSGFFCAYAVFRMLYPGNWHAASAHYLDWRIGAVNTAVLLLSSFTVVLAIRGAQTNRNWMIQVNLLITNLCAAFFLVVKLTMEYYPKWQKGELPGAAFNYAHPTGTHDNLFLSVYWVATATHGVHVLVGIIVLTMCMLKAARREFGPRHYTFLENTGLYWHIVDVIWIFLFPLLYLV